MSPKSPKEIWKRAFPNENGWRDAFNAIPFWFDAVKKPRYYQELAVNRRGCDDGA